MGFTSKFFSRSGQKERLGNVAKYLQLGASKITAGIIPAPANTDANFRSSSKLGRIADLIVNNPKTAALVATGATYAGKAAVNYVQQAAPAVAGKTKSVRKSVSQYVTSMRAQQKPGLIQSQQQQKTGLIQPTSSSSEPVSPNAGTITPSTPSRAASNGTNRRRKTRKASKKRTKKRTLKRSRKKRYGTAKQYARKGGKKVYYAKNGTPYIKLANGKARFVKGKRK